MKAKSTTTKNAKAKSKSVKVKKTANGESITLKRKKPHPAKNNFALEPKLINTDPVATLHIDVYCCKDEYHAAQIKTSGQMDALMGALVQTMLESEEHYELFTQACAHAVAYKCIPTKKPKKAAKKKAAPKKSVKAKK